MDGSRLTTESHQTVEQKLLKWPVVFESFPDLIVRMDGFRTSGSHAVFLWSLEGTNTGPDGTGNRVEVSGWEYWRFNDDGLVAESFGHFNADDYERQLTGS